MGVSHQKKLGPNFRMTAPGRSREQLPFLPTKSFGKVTPRSHVAGHSGALFPEAFDHEGGVKQHHGWREAH
jgi:hypothetical protein